MKKRPLSRAGAFLFGYLTVTLAKLKATKSRHILSANMSVILTKIQAMKTHSVLTIALCAVALAFGRVGCANAAPAPEVLPTEIMPTNSDILKTLKPTHPRLLIADDSWAQLKARRAQDAQLDAFLKRQEIEARALLPVAPVVYQKTGRRLLSVSRTVLWRVMLLSMQYKLTGDRQFLERAQAEMLAVAQFDDWNPSHFLDTAEMTAALAIGYDWLYDDLDAESRVQIETAIRDKGLNAGITNNGWVKATNNWNSVCNAGMVMGALAIANEEPQLAQHYVAQAIESNPRVLKSYAPDGVYPEGPSYWAYGTTFQVMLVSSLRSALGKDWNLTQAPGFMQSAEALFHLAGPSGTFYNYSDGGERAGLEGTTYWFARQLNQPGLTRLENDSMRKYLASAPKPDSENDRTLPLAALWWTAATAKAKPLDLPLNWLGRGENPLVTFRGSWNNPDAMWLALKGGKATNSHGHMDAGSFVFESDGVRWARDLGMQNYESLESKGVNLWDSKQDGDRWKVFRLGPFSHNTLTINGQLHRADGDARITRFDDVAAVGAAVGAAVDLSPVFAGQAARVTRGFLFRAGQDVTIRDEVEGLKAGDTARFALMTGATIQVSDDGKSATLTSKDKSLIVKLVENSGAKWEIASAQGPSATDVENKGMHLLIANFTAPNSGAMSWAVTLQPGSVQVASANPLTSAPIADWPLAAVK